MGPPSQLQFVVVRWSEHRAAGLLHAFLPRCCRGQFEQESSSRALETTSAWSAPAPCSVLDDRPRRRCSTKPGARRPAAAAGVAAVRHAGRRGQRVQTSSSWKSKANAEQFELELLEFTARCRQTRCPGSASSAADRRHLEALTLRRHPASGTVGVARPGARRTRPVVHAARRCLHGAVEIAQRVISISPLEETGSRITASSFGCRAPGARMASRRRSNRPARPPR